MESRKEGQIEGGLDRVEVVCRGMGGQSEGGVGGRSDVRGGGGGGTE